MKRTMLIDEIKWVPEIYPREKWNTATVERYADAMIAGDVFPPVTIEKDTGILLDGKHRLEAYKKAALIAKAAIDSPDDRTFTDVPVDVAIVPAGMSIKYFAATVNIDPEFQALIPELSQEEKAQLEANLVAEGCRDALVIWRGVILDGHNRFEICQRLKIKYEVICKDFEDRNDAMLWVINNQFGRRNINLYDRGILALRMKDIIAAKAKENLSKGGGDKKSVSAKSGLTTLSKAIAPINTRAEIAKKSGVSEGTIAKIEIIQKKASPEQIGRLKSGDASINQINNEIVKPHVSQNKGENEWNTPPEYTEAARKVMGDIDLDPASNKIANRTVTAKTFYTKKDSGLDKAWAGKVWMNPPYDTKLIKKFITKFVAHVKSGEITEGMVLVNNASETGWFTAIAEVSSAAVFLGKRVKFLDPQGNPGAPLQGQTIFYVGDNHKLFNESFKTIGWRVLNYDYYEKEFEEYLKKKDGLNGTQN